MTITERRPGDAPQHGNGRVLTAVLTLVLAVTGLMLAFTAMMLLLAVLAELAIWLVGFSGGGTVASVHYLPMMSVLIYSLALTAGYAVVAPAGEGGEHRGPVRHTDPVRRDLD